MRKFLLTIAFLATVVGLFVLVFLPERQHMLWLLLPAAAVIAASWEVGPAATKAAVTGVRRIQHYEADLAAADTKATKALASAAEQIRQNTDLLERVQTLERAVEVAEERGVTEGRRRVVGELLASSSGASLALVGLVIEEGQLIMVARLASGDLPPVGSRCLLRVHDTRAKAVVAVAVQDATAGAVMLTVDEVVDQVFMDGLRRRVEAGEPDPPVSLRVTARDSAVPETFLFDDWAQA